LRRERANTCFCARVGALYTDRRVTPRSDECQKWCANRARASCTSQSSSRITVGSEAGTTAGGDRAGAPLLRDDPARLRSITARAHERNGLATTTPGPSRCKCPHPMDFGGLIRTRLDQAPRGDHAPETIVIGNARRKLKRFRTPIDSSTATRTLRPKMVRATGEQSS